VIHEAQGMYDRAELAACELSDPAQPQRLRALKASQLGLRGDSAPQSAPQSAQHGTEQKRHYIRGSRQWLSNRDQQRADPPPARYVSKRSSPIMLTRSPRQSDRKHHRVRHLPSPSSAIPTMSIDRLCWSRPARNVPYLRPGLRLWA
jgi:hypothetical protein